jgi:hypothetical protein
MLSSFCLESNEKLLLHIMSRVAEQFNREVLSLGAFQKYQSNVTGVCVCSIIFSERTRSIALSPLMQHCPGCWQTGVAAVEIPEYNTATRMNEPHNYARSLGVEITFTITPTLL